ncbi:glycosyltransferase [Candidatus Chloroploca sp. Khr17]|uniref:glycosyltransferase n=1 Tax=Candidatus Chloroploca sp. Khr17 TaxID=2496869 RepID=UPI00101CB889|nr:glycosyltransferase [Candidatus Chloroploca sp. Khr17]
MRQRKINILTVGSRGDVEPYVALGVGLQQAGYAVTLATEAGFEGLVREHGLAFAPLRAEFIHLAQSSEGKAALAGKNPFGLMQRIKPMLRNILDDAWAASQAAEAIIYHPKALAGYHLAEKLQVPGFLTMMLPAYSPTRIFSNPALGGQNYGDWVNWFTYTLFLRGATLPYRSLINAWRKERLGLPPFRDDTILRGKPVPKMYAYSQHVVPKPPDWDASTFVSGYWFLPTSASWQPSAALEAFLAQGPPPVYVGFGSMASQDAARTTKLVLAAAAQAGQRVILASGWGGLSTADLPATAFALEAAPHAWLFPRCAAVVHHGGAGTTGAGLRAGKPTVICPFFGDQPFWGQRVFALGVGPWPVPQKKLTVERLARAIEVAVSDQAMRQRAEALGAKIRAEDGVARAIEFMRTML